MECFFGAAGVCAASADVRGRGPAPQGKLRADRAAKRRANSISGRRVPGGSWPRQKKVRQPNGREA